MTLKHETALEFILGGNALFTCRNTKTGNRFTFKVTKHRKDDIFFVKVLTNPDVYEFIGSVRTNYKHSVKSRISDDAQSVQVFKYIVSKLKSNTLPGFIEIWHEGRCGRCGRVLTVPESIETGFGPECSKRKSKK